MKPLLLKFPISVCLHRGDSSSHAKQMCETSLQRGFQVKVLSYNCWGYSVRAGLLNMSDFDQEAAAAMVRVVARIQLAMGLTADSTKVWASEEPRTGLFPSGAISHDSPVFTQDLNSCVCIGPLLSIPTACLLEVHLCHWSSC